MISSPYRANRQIRFALIARRTQVPLSRGTCINIVARSELCRDADRYNHRDGNDDYKQVTALFNLFDAGQKARLFLNCAEAMWGIPHEIAERQLAHFKEVHSDYEAGVRRELANMTRSKASETAQQQKMPQGVEAAE